jgi:hypothetical protein
MNILQKLGVKGSEGKTYCPAHEDDKASLSVKEVEGGKILLKCFAGCSQEEVIAALSSQHGISLEEIQGDAVPNQVRNSLPRARKKLAEYHYRNAAGEIMFTKIRYEPKDFCIIGDYQPIIYGLPEVHNANVLKTVLWVEGEKAVDRLRGLGLLATTVGGASKSPDFAVNVLKGRNVVILPDNDDAGKKHAEIVSRCLKANGVHAVRILELPGLPVKGDVCDFLDMGHSVGELNALVRKSLGYTLASSVVPQSPQWAWQPRIPAKGLSLIFGEAGIGKSTMIVDMIARWTRGDPMPETVGGPFSPITVAVYGFEDDPKSVVIPRLMAAGADLTKVAFLEPDPKRPVIPDQVPYLQQVCRELDARVLIIDNIENGFGQIETNNSKSLRGALVPLGEFGIPVVAIHHPKKGSVFVDPTEAMGGSQAYTNVARSTMLVIPTGDEPDAIIAFSAVKNNYAPISQTRTLYYRIVTREIEGLGQQPYVEWQGGDNLTARYWVKVARQRRDEKMRAEGPALHKEQEDQARRFGDAADSWVREQQEKMIAKGRE